MGNDVHHIEAQKKGAHVVSNNKTILLDELLKYLKSLRAPNYKSLKSDLTNVDNVYECDKTIEQIIDGKKLDTIKFDLIIDFKEHIIDFIKLFYSCTNTYVSRLAPKVYCPTPIRLR